MGTEITKRDIPAPTPEIAASLSPQDLCEHRAKIASEVRVVLSAYFQPQESADVRDAQLAWWCDELQDWSVEQVVYGLREWNRDNPRLRPTPGDITKLLRQIRGRAVAERMAESRQPEPPREKLTLDRAAEIMAAAGFNPKKMEGNT